MTAELTSMKEKEKKYKNRLRESERTLVMVANEKDELSAAKDKHTKSISQLQAQLQEAESMKDALDQQLAELENENQSLSNKSSVLEQSNAETKKSLEAIENEASRQKAEWMEEKTKLIEEKNKLKERIHESETTLVMVANQKTSLEKEKTDLERKLSSELIATEGKHSKKIAELQSRLEDTVSSKNLKVIPYTCIVINRLLLFNLQQTRTLANLKSEKDTLHRSVEDLQRVNQDLSAEWNEERNKLIEEKNKLKNHIHKSETTLVMVANQKTSLEKEKTDLERKLSSELIATEGKHSKKIAELQRRLEDTVSAEKKVCFLKAMPIHFLTTYVSSLISINNRIAP